MEKATPIAEQGNFSLIRNIDGTTLRRVKDSEKWLKARSAKPKSTMGPRSKIPRRHVSVVSAVEEGEEVVLLSDSDNSLNDEPATHSPIPDLPSVPSHQSGALAPILEDEQEPEESESLAHPATPPPPREELLDESDEADGQVVKWRAALSVGVPNSQSQHAPRSRIAKSDFGGSRGRYNREMPPPCFCPPSK